MTSTPAWAASGFVTGTFVQTSRGLRQVERLEAGVDVLEFRDGETAPLLHMHTSTFSAEELEADEAARPLLIPALALGGKLPNRDTYLSPNMHLLAGGRLVRRMAEAPEVMMPLNALIGFNGIERVIPKHGVTYYHPVAAEHDLIRANGLICEVMFLGRGTHSDLTQAVRKVAPEVKAVDARIERVLPDIAGKLAAKLMSKNRPVGMPDTE